jgi:hypothetical protein
MPQSLLEEQVLLYAGSVHLLYNLERPHARLSERAQIWSIDSYFSGSDVFHEELVSQACIDNVQILSSGALQYFSVHAFRTLPSGFCRQAISEQYALLVPYDSLVIRATSCWRRLRKLHRISAKFGVNLWLRSDPLNFHPTFLRLPTRTSSHTRHSTPKTQENISSVFENP